jgi:hypothetical protein
MFSNNEFFHKNGKQQQVYSQHSISPIIGSNNIHNPTPSNKRMEKLILHAVLTTGFGAYLFAIFLNIGTWKADLLFFMGAAFIILKFIRLSIRTWQDYKRTEIEIRIKRKESEK